MNHPTEVYQERIEMWLKSQLRYEIMDKRDFLFDKVELDGRENQFFVVESINFTGEWSTKMRNRVLIAHRRFDAKGALYKTEERGQEIKVGEYEFRNLYLYANIDDEHIPKRAVYTDTQFQLVRYNDLVFDVYEAEDINTIVDHTSQGFVNEHPFTFYSQSVEGCQSLRSELNWSDFYNSIADILNDLKWSLGQAIIYRKQLESPIYETGNLSGEYYVLKNDIFIVRYLMLCNSIFEKLYNFWDRIGDLMDKFVDTGLKLRSIDFSRVVDAYKLKYDWQNQEDLLWLVDFKENDYKQLNITRRRVVHYNYLQSDIFKESLEHVSNKDEIEKLEANLLNLHSVLRKELDRCSEGFIKACNFIRVNLYASPKPQPL